MYAFNRWDHMSYLFQKSNILKFPDKSSVKSHLHKNEYFNKNVPTSFKN